jgi:hypothetical protein
MLELCDNQQLSREGKVIVGSQVPRRPGFNAENRLRPGSRATVGLASGLRRSVVSLFLAGAGIDPGLGFPETMQKESIVGDGLLDELL